MTEPVTRCLEQETIRQFLGGFCDEPQAEGIAAHLAECVICSAAANKINQQSDTIARLVKSADQRLELEPACQAARRHLLGTSAPPLTMPLLPLAIGQYELLEPIGRGGMGRVFKAVHRHLKRTMAVKLLLPERAHDTEAVAAFLREMEAIGRLESPHVVRANDAACIDGVYFLAMDYVPGPDLARLLDRIPRLDVADACEIIRQAAIGLQYAHENGLVHCDIKPSNLILTEHGVVKILDLGLARILTGSSASPSAAVAGTIDYMAPEQWLPDAAVDIRADIYGLGCTFFKLLVGKAPFEQSSLTRRQAHGSAPIPSLHELRSAVPASLDKIVERMLAKRPEDRFAEPKEVAAALEPFCEGHRLASLAERVADGSADTLRVGRAADTKVSRKPAARFASRKWVIAALLALFGFAAIRGSMAVFRPSTTDDGWRSIQLANAHPHRSLDANAIVVPRQESGQTELEVSGRGPVCVRMGSANRLPLQLRAVFRPDFSGHAGIYFALGDETAAVRNYQSVIVRRDDANSGKAVIQWATHTWGGGNGGQSEFVIRSWPVDFQSAQTFQSIEISATEQGLGVRWNGVAVADNAVADSDAPPTAWQFQGAYGLLVEDGRAICRRFQFKIFGSN